MHSEKIASNTTTVIAQRLGLSRWTVSRILNGHDGVKPETVRRVQQAMLDMGYEPNAYARSLRGARSKIVGICFQELDSPLLARKAGLLQGIFREKGYQALIELTQGDHQHELSALRHFVALRAEGVVLVGSALRQQETALLQKNYGMPVVWVDPEHSVDGEVLSLDRAYSMKITLRHLHGLGHRQFAVLGIDPENPYGAPRWKSFLAECRRLKVDVERHVHAIYEPGCRQHTYDYGRVLGGRFLEECPGTTTAIICVNDRVAVGVSNTLMDAGRDIPGDVSIAGYDNIDVSAFFRPPLTTVDQRAEHLMREAAELLIRRMEGDASPFEKRRILPRLVVRASTAKATR